MLIVLYVVSASCSKILYVMAEVTSNADDLSYTATNNVHVGCTVHIYNGLGCALAKQGTLGGLTLLLHGDG